MVAGFDSTGKPRLFLTEPSGSNTEWTAATIGHNSKNVLESLEKNYLPDLSDQDALKLALKCILEVVERGSKNVEVAIIRQDSIENLTDEQVQAIIAELEAAS